MSSGTVYTPAPTPTSFELADLFPEIGSPIEQPQAAATAINFILLREQPHNWTQLAKGLGISEEKLKYASDRLWSFHNISDCGMMAIGNKLDLIAEQYAAYHQKEIIQSLRESYGKYMENDVAEPEREVSTKYNFPTDHLAPSQPNATAEALIAAIEELRPISWYELSDKLNADINDLMRLCKLLAREYSHDKLSMASLYHYFNANAAAKASTNSKLINAFTAQTN